MGKLKKLAQEFKAFITRGNVVDMAVAVIIGAAFGAIVTALTNGILQPLIDWAIIKAGGGNGIGLITPLNMVYVDGVVDLAASTYIDWGTFIMKIIDFLLVALVLFIIIKIFMTLKNAGEQLTSKDRKALKKQVKQRAKEKGITKDEALAEIQAEEKAKAEAEKEPAKPTTEELLIQIRDLLIAQNEKSSK